MRENESVVGRTDGGVVTFVEDQIHSFLSSQLKLDMLSVAVILVSWSNVHPSIRVNQVPVSPADIRIITLRVHPSLAGVEVGQGALVYVGAVAEGVPSEASLAGAVVRAHQVPAVGVILTVVTSLRTLVNIPGEQVSKIS